MELAQSAAEHGVRAIHGAEIDLATDPASRARRGRHGHITLLVRDERGWRNLCRIITLAHAHTRDGPGRRELGEPSVAACRPCSTHAEGLRLPDRLRRALGARRRARATSRRRGDAARRVRPRAPLRRAAAPVRAPRPRSQPALAALARRLGHAMRGHRRRPRALARPGRAAGRLRGAAQPRHARRLRAAAPRQPQPRDEHAAGDGQPLRRPSRGGRRDAAAGRAADVRPDARTSATAIPAPRSDDASRRLAELCGARLQERYGPRRAGPRAGSPRRGRARAWRRSCG